MDFQSENAKKLVFVCFLFSQVLITNSIPDYIFITQPPAELLCNPHSTATSDIGLECSIGIIGKDQLPVETRIVWFRRTPSNYTDEQLCETDISLLMAATPFTSTQSVLLRSTVHLRATQLGDLTGEYWCQVAKTIRGGLTVLSNNSSVLSVGNSQYYSDNKLDNCDNGTIFLDISSSHQSVDFSSSSITTEEFLCSLGPSSADFPSEPEEIDDSITLSRMWVYILAPVISAVLIMTFLFLLIALITTCIQKRDSTKKHHSTIGLSANIELDAASNHDTQIKSNGLSVGNATVAFVGNIRSVTQTPTPKSSSTHLEHSKQIILNKQKPLQQQEEKQTGAQNQNSDDEEYYYTHVPSRNGRNAAEVLGRLKGVCTGVQLGSSAPVKSSSGDDDHAGNLEYRSLDPEALEPAHTYHAMQSSAPDGPQPAHSKPGVRGHRKPVLANGHRPSPPMKIPPRAHARKNKRLAHVPVRSVPSVDGEYVDPNNQKSHLYQGLTPERQEYLALYMTPDSSPH